MAAPQADATRWGNDRAFQSPSRLKKALRILQSDNQEAVSIISKLDTVFDEDAVESAFGAPGEPGDAERIKALAEKLILVYDQMLEWSERAHSTKTADDATQLMHIHAQLLERPIQQIDDYLARWVALADDLPRLVTEAEETPHPLQVDMSLKLAIDDTVLETFKAEVARVRRNRLGRGNRSAPSAA